jgi:hypothetical protein
MIGTRQNLYLSATVCVQIKRAGRQVTPLPLLDYKFTLFKYDNDSIICAKAEISRVTGYSFS